MSEHVFDGQLFAWDEDAPDSWVFVAVPAEVSDDVADEVEGRAARGFGAVRVLVSVGASEWETSLFPSKELGAYVLPLKKPVRRAEGLEPGDVATFTLEVL